MMKESTYPAGDTICALSSAAGQAAIAIVRISGPSSHGAIAKLMRGKIRENDPIQKPGMMTYARLYNGEEEIDKTMICCYKGPNSYTGEDMAEIFCHGSLYIQKRLLEVLISSGIRLADPGEFTRRAFLNGKLNLTQAEAIGDLIAANSYSAHHLALRQMKKGFSDEIAKLRQNLVEFAALVELELDFSTEDVEFANRNELMHLLQTIENETTKLVNSFARGNVLRNGIPVVIAGEPNVGKSTLLNALLNEDRAIVSDIPGTTRDTVEDVLTYEGVTFRFIDTAGLRKPDDKLEQMGIDRSMQAIAQASVVLYVADATTADAGQIGKVLQEFRQKFPDVERRYVVVINKTDCLLEIPGHFSEFADMETVFVSAKRHENIEVLLDLLIRSAGKLPADDEVIISNLRHYQALSETRNAVIRAMDEMQKGVPSDLYSTYIRSALYHLGLITGEITPDEVLGQIFGRFCIGK